MKSILSKTTRTNPMYYFLLVGVVVYFCWPYLLKLLEPNIVMNPKVIVQAPPTLAAVPKIILDAEKKAMSYDPQMLKLEQMGKVIQKKSEILDNAKKHDLVVEFDDQVVKESSSDDITYSLTNRTTGKERILPEFDFGFDKEVLDTALDQVDSETDVSHPIDEQLAYPSLLNKVRVAMTYQSEGAVKVILNVDDDQWDTNNSLVFKSLRVKNISLSQICVSEGDLNECFKI
ncbi:hypothetical protein AB6E94_19740 [Vibrio lentus]|uniref:hypothetical protein n=1 Tax=Vibrio splendidus TaxID=29497 RepID=UPI000C83A4E3|nr:hypothetical protein [Vibrio splendidus]PMG17939.1 hypothetical protein BCU98_00975 [Vibrio splendidus]